MIMENLFLDFFYNRIMRFYELIEAGYSIKFMIFSEFLYIKIDMTIKDLIVFFLLVRNISGLNLIRQRNIKKKMMKFNKIIEISQRL